jgi:hypothetical protein
MTSKSEDRRNEMRGKLMVAFTLLHQAHGEMRVCIQSGKIGRAMLVLNELAEMMRECPRGCVEK